MAFFKILVLYILFETNDVLLLSEDESISNGKFWRLLFLVLVSEKSEVCVGSKIGSEFWSTYIIHVLFTAYEK